MISLTCDYHPGASDDATIHHPTEISSSGIPVSSSQEPKVVKSFLAESYDQKWCRPLLPLCQKSERAENQNFGGHFSRRIYLLLKGDLDTFKESLLIFDKNLKN